MREPVAALVSANADGVIVGGAYVEIYEDNLQHPDNTLRGVAWLAR